MPLARFPLRRGRIGVPHDTPFAGWPPHVLCELMRRRGPFCFYAFDLLWLDGKDFRNLILLERKKLLRKLLPRRAQPVLYVRHVESGVDLFRAICERDMEGVIAKQTSGRYTPEATSWVKIKNRLAPG